MAKSNNQKAKILYLEKMLRETGEHRVISMQKILENLEKQGIRAERKSIYDDVEKMKRCILTTECIYSIWKRTIV